MLPGPKERLPGVVYQAGAKLAEYAAAGALTNETLVSAFAEMVRRFPARHAIVEAEGHCTYAELDLLTDRAAAGFLALGLEPLDRVIFQATNSRELVVALIACFKAALIPICTLAAHRRLEIAYIGRHAGARAHFIIGDDPKFDFVAFSHSLHADIPTLRHTVLLRGTPEPGSDDQTLAGLILGQSPAASRERLATIALDPFQVAIFQLSGGTTGIPKIIPRFHNEYLAAIRSVISFHGLDDTTIAFTPNPMIHNSPMQCVWGPSLFAGGAVAICPSLDPAVQGPFLVRARPNWMLLSASVALRLKESGWLDRIETRVVRGFLVGSGAAKLRQLLGDAPTWPLFGMTEGLLCSCNASDPAAARTETTGRPLSPHDEIRLLVAGGDDEVAFGEIGELALRGPCTIRGYYDAADRNEVAFTVDGFYRSGDLMRQREIGGRHYLVFEGRLKDVVDRGGEKINCEEIERVCAQHPAIGDVAVVAMPDPDYGQRACAFVIPLAGRRAPDVRELGAFLERVGLAKFKWPERIEIVEAFPLTSSGKLSKPKLRERIEATLRAEQDVAQAGPNTQVSPRSLA